MNDTILYDSSNLTDTLYDRVSGLCIDISKLGVYAESLASLSSLLVISVFNFDFL